MAIHYIGLSLIWIHFCLRKLTFEINYSLASLKLHMFENLIVVIFKINIFVLKAGANPGFKDKAGRHSLHWDIFNLDLFSFTNLLKEADF